MATRSGDLDPGLVLWLLQQGDYGPTELERLLAGESGLLGLAGNTGDLSALAKSSDEDARLAVDVFVWRVRKYVGAYLAVLGGADAILIGGGIGEHLPAHGILLGPAPDAPLCGVRRSCSLGLSRRRP
jgi:acetate kinase